MSSRYTYRAVVLRSKRPELVEQEFYALLLAHAAVRRLMTEAAATRQVTAETLSFVHAVRVLKRRLPGSGAFPPLSSGKPGLTASLRRSRPAGRSAVTASATRGVCGAK